MRPPACWLTHGGAWPLLRLLGCRLKATLQRLRRLTEQYSQMMLDAYAERAVVMGRALGLETERYQGGWEGGVHGREGGRCCCLALAEQLGCG